MLSFQKDDLGNSSKNIKTNFIAFSSTSDINLVSKFKICISMSLKEIKLNAFFKIYKDIWGKYSMG